MDLRIIAHNMPYALYHYSMNFKQQIGDSF